MAMLRRSKPWLFSTCPVPEGPISHREITHILVLHFSLWNNYWDYLIWLVFNKFFLWWLELYVYIKPVVFLNEIFQDCPNGHLPMNLIFPVKRKIIVCFFETYSLLGLLWHFLLFLNKFAFLTVIKIDIMYI